MGLTSTIGRVVGTLGWFVSSQANDDLLQENPQKNPRHAVQTVSRLGQPTCSALILPTSKAVAIQVEVALLGALSRRVRPDVLTCRRFAVVWEHNGTRAC
jgi:hypothetical protein